MREEKVENILQNRKKLVDLMKLEETLKRHIASSKLKLELSMVEDLNKYELVERIHMTLDNCEKLSIMSNTFHNFDYSEKKIDDEVVKWIDEVNTSFNFKHILKEKKWDH